MKPAQLEREGGGVKVLKDPVCKQSVMKTEPGSILWSGGFLDKFSTKSTEMLEF